MERRAFVKIAALTALSHQVRAQSVMAHMQMAAAPPAAAYTLQFFTQEESVLLDELMEMIVPADEHSPGAQAAKTNLFADLLVAGGSDETRQQWRNGLRLLREQAAGSSLSAVLAAAAAKEEKPVTETELFFVVLKQMTVEGYYTSEIGIHQEMEYVGNAYVAAFPECTHSDQHAVDSSA